MPNHIYRCTQCEYQESRLILGLPSEEVLDAPFKCNGCGALAMKRRPCLVSSSFGMPKERAGDWFKKTYGHDIGEKDEEKAEQQRNMDQVKRSLEAKHGIKMNTDNNQPWPGV